MTRTADTRKLVYVLINVPTERPYETLHGQTFRYTTEILWGYGLSGEYPDHVILGEVRLE